MANLVARYRVATEVGGPSLTMQLNGPSSTDVSGGSNLASLATTAGDLHLLSKGGHGVVVQGDTGFVGIGNTNPLHALDVIGAAYVSGALNVTGTSKHTGNVGVGKDPAGNALDVSGDVWVTGKITASNLQCWDPAPSSTAWRPSPAT